MAFQDLFPIWSKLTPAQQSKMESSVFFRTLPKGTVVHDGSLDCVGLVFLKKGQLRAYILSEDGREVTLYRLIEQDLCIFSASCMMPSVQFEITIATEKDSEVYILPAPVFKSIMEESPSRIQCFGVILFYTIL